jgi:hypothetical protein
MISKLLAGTSPRRALFTILALTLLLALPSIAVGFFGDDYILRAELSGLSPIHPPAWDLYRFTGTDAADNKAVVAAGGLMWWSAPALHMHLVRPLGSLLFAFDVAAFGDAPLGYHLHSIVWYLLLVAAVSALFRRILPEGVSTLATLLFAINPAHVFPWGWAAARHATVATLFVVLALDLLMRARQRSWPAGNWLAALAFAFALAAGESGLGGVGYVVAYAAIGGGQGGAPGTSGAAARWRQVFPILTTSAIYLVLYMLAGGGAGHSDGYVAPTTSPIGFARLAVRRFPALLADAAIGLPADLALLLPPWPFALAAAISCGALFALYRAVRPGIPADLQGTLGWLLAGATLAVASTLGGFPGARLLIVPDVGFAAFFATLFWWGFRAQGSRGAALRARRWGVGLFAAIQGVFAPVSALASTGANMLLARHTEAMFHEITETASPGERVFVLVASDPIVGMLTPLMGVAVPQERAKWSGTCWSVGSMTKATHRITRTGPDSFTIEALDSTFLKSSFETLYRTSAEPLHVGDTAEQCGGTYRVLALGRPSDPRSDEDLRPTRIELTLPKDDGHRRVAVWDAGHLRDLPPMAVGESREVAWSPGPMGVL